MLRWVLGCPRVSRASDTRVGEHRDDCRRASGFGREALLKACLATLLASECSVPEATTIQLNIIFVLADDPNLAARQLLALGPALTEKGNSFENAFVDYSTRCVAPEPPPSPASTATTNSVGGNVFAAGGFEKFRNEGNEKNTISAHPQESGYQTPCSASASTSTRETVRLTPAHRQPYSRQRPLQPGGGAVSP